MPFKLGKRKILPENPNDRLVYKVLAYLLGALLLVVIIKFSIISIPAGHSGVLWQRFFGGTRIDRSYDEGLLLIFPWDKMAIYDVRTQVAKENVTALASTGLPVKIEIVVFFRPDREYLPLLHKEIGPDYADKLVRPTMKAIVRHIVGQLSEEEIFSSQKELTNRLNLIATVDFAENHLDLLDVFLVEISLPKTLTEAIEQKMVQKERIATKTFAVDAEKQEAIRKKIEAEGIKDYNDLVSASLNKDILTWSGIEATHKLSESKNAKTVIIGGGAKGLPIILNQ